MQVLYNGNISHTVYVPSDRSSSPLSFCSTLITFHIIAIGPLFSIANNTLIITSTYSQDGPLILQAHRVEIEPWRQQTYLKISTIKSTVSSFCAASWSCQPFGLPLHDLESLTVSGVTFSRTLNFSAQLRIVVPKARRISCFVDGSSRHCSDWPVPTLGFCMDSASCT